MRHKFADVIIAWANGAQIQWRCQQLHDREWQDSVNPCWDNTNEYRIKPQPKPDVVSYCAAVVGHSKKYAWMHRASFSSYLDAKNSNLTLGDQLSGVVKFTIDGETCQLKSVEIVREGGD